MDYNQLAREAFARQHAQQIKLLAAVKSPPAAARGVAPANATLNPHPLGGVAAGANAALVVAAEQRVGYLTTAEQLAGGNPGLPSPGSLQYADYRQRGLL
jgi:hypothetical protein